MPLYFLPEERRPEAAEALSDAEGEALADAEAEAVSEAVAASADPGHPQGFRLSVPCVPCVPCASAEFRQNLGEVSAQFLHSFGTKKPRPRCITAGGGEAYLKPLGLNR